MSIDQQLSFFAITFLLLIFFSITGFAHSEAEIRAGFSCVDITPPIGTPMTGFGAHFRDRSGVKGIHDPLEARAIFLEQGTTRTLIMGMDLCFLNRKEADRMKGAIGRKLNLLPRDILLNCSHNHTGPMCSDWFYLPPAPYYMDFLEESLVKAAVEASHSLEPVSIQAGETTTKLPVNRRLPNPESGQIDFAPNPQGSIYPYLPFVVFNNSAGKPLCILFSVSAHPSNIKGVDRSFYISADYPGVAVRLLDKHIGRKGALFLQGAAGCAKCSVVPGRDKFPSGTWEEVETAGKMVADEVCAALDGKLQFVEPSLLNCSVELSFPLLPPLKAEDYRKVIEQPDTHAESMPEVKRVWAEDMLSCLKGGFSLSTTVPMTAQGIRLGKGFRIVAIEAEIVDAHGHQIRNSYPDGITMPLGYSNGCQMYLPTSAMLPEGGYEVESYWEYHKPAPLAPGIESILADGISHLMKEGIQ
ncbi:MAG: hypothetical protein KJ050_02005 [Candidatus Omnitrophica bacterium]|nr:hypothetical protein [Candidatus Omnitrophota bacterium]